MCSGVSSWLPESYQRLLNCVRAPRRVAQGVVREGHAAHTINICSRVISESATGIDDSVARPPFQMIEPSGAGLRELSLRLGPCMTSETRHTGELPDSQPLPACDGRAIGDVVSTPRKCLTNSRNAFQENENPPCDSERCQQGMNGQIEAPNKRENLLHGKEFSWWGGWDSNPRRPN